mmetsp:Transcript_29028/g.42802  ORF Transcript_29028/g.42802 Transcript_29028/m.42802 type:complete len:225 (+) Transcript_29028:987-1661(+)
MQQWSCLNLIPWLEEAMMVVWKILFLSRMMMMKTTTTTTTWTKTKVERKKLHYGPLDASGNSLPVEMTCIWNDPRHRAMLDLSGPEVAILLSARRIQLRDALKNEEERGFSYAPLTYERIAREYETSFVAVGRSSGPDRYEPHVLRRAFSHLLECDVMRPEVDHTGKGPRQYFFAHEYSLLNDMTLVKMPLHVTLDLDREVGEALRRRLLDCSSALREWGMKMN